MNSKHRTKKRKKRSNQNDSKEMIGKIRSIYILKIVFNYITKNKLLNIVKFNKNIQQKLYIDINTYKEYSEIAIEIIPIQNKYGNFININNKDDEKYYHIYFDDNKEEIKRTYYKGGDKFSKINIIIEYHVNSFKELFAYCKNIKSIYFKRFYRKNIKNMSYMFFVCSSLEELNLSNFNTDNVIDMSSMFQGCSSLKELDLSNFNTKNVTNMSKMFCYCSSLKNINLSNFNTVNVNDMSAMFCYCSSLKKLKISNFNTNKVTNMSAMFSFCSSLEKLKLSKECSEEFKTSIKKQLKNFKVKIYFF